MSKTHNAEIDGDTEDLCLLLTHVLGVIDPTIDYGVTYEALVRLIVRLIDGHIVTEEDAFNCGREIVSARGPEARQLH